jgi:hypothetical protein
MKRVTIEMTEKQLEILKKYFAKEAKKRGDSLLSNGKVKFQKKG